MPLKDCNCKYKLFPTERGRDVVSRRGKQQHTLLSINAGKAEWTFVCWVYVGQCASEVSHLIPCGFATILLDGK